LCLAHSSMVKSPAFLAGDFEKSWKSIVSEHRLPPGELTFVVLIIEVLLCVALCVLRFGVFAV
jgi:hypothetical protein